MKSANVRERAKIDKTKINIDTFAESIKFDASVMQPVVFDSIGGNFAALNGNKEALEKLEEEFRPSPPPPVVEDCKHEEDLASDEDDDQREEEHEPEPAAVLNVLVEQETSKSELEGLRARTVKTKLIDAEEFLTGSIKQQNSRMKVHNYILRKKSGAKNEIEKRLTNARNLAEFASSHIEKNSSLFLLDRNSKTA